MAIRRVRQKIERSPEQLAELRRVQDNFQRAMPSLGDLIASGDFEGPFRHGDVMAFLSAIAQLRRERGRRGLSLADISDGTTVGGCPHTAPIARRRLDAAQPDGNAKLDDRGGRGCVIFIRLHPDGEVDQKSLDSP